MSVESKNSNFKPWKIAIRDTELDTNSTPLDKYKIKRRHYAAFQDKYSSPLNTTIHSTKHGWIVSEKTSHTTNSQQKQDKISDFIEYLRRKINHVLNVQDTIKTEKYDQLLRENTQRDSLLQERIEKEKSTIYRRSFPNDQKIQKYISLLSKSNPSALINEQFSVPIHLKDIQTLFSKQWLNDEVINFYFQVLQHRSTFNNGLPRIFCMNTFFYTNLELHGYERVKRWSRRFNYGDLDYILIPVHLGVHWTLGVIDIKDQCICYFDSLSSSGSSKKFIALIRDYLIKEKHDKLSPSLNNVTAWNEYIPYKNIPKQENGYDCGVFTCQYATCISSLPKQFSIQKYCESGYLFDFDQSNIPLIRNHMIALLGQYDSRINNDQSYMKIIQFH